MTYEELKVELVKRGFPKTRVDAKYIQLVMDIVLGTDVFENMAQQEEETRRHENRVLSARLKADAEIKKIAYDLGTTKNKLRADVEYVANFYKALFDCDTEEGKDNMRAAQVFINSVNINTVYDNTAFIIGLAAILSGGKVGAIEELHKLNSKIPSPQEPPKREARTI